MANDSSNKPPSGNVGDSGTSTRVDLGDDLLSSTVLISKKDGAQKTESNEGGVALPSTPEDRFENARILISEGFVEDAKKLLRKILIDDPAHTAAKKSLQELLDRELRDLLMDRDSPVQRPRLFERKGKQARAPQSTSDEMIAELEEEFGLNEKGADEPVEPVELKAQLDRKTATETDRIDLGIAFLEMELCDQAAVEFQRALELIEQQVEPDAVLRVSATALLCRAYLQGGRAFDAIQVLHGVLRDGEIPADQKIECFYLMGLAHEKTGDRKGALPWFGKVRDLDPQYRDIQERLRKPIT